MNRAEPNEPQDGRNEPDVLCFYCGRSIENVEGRWVDSGHFVFCFDQDDPELDQRYVVARAFSDVPTDQRHEPAIRRANPQPAKDYKLPSRASEE